jgi:D-hydroxyproline dehydrogenase subunit beta
VYSQHYATKGASADEDPQITFTATMGVSGSLLLGSSRDTNNWDPAIEQNILSAILTRATTFLPDLESLDIAGTEVRIGFRPYSRTGLPVIGPVPGSPGVFVAAGHEGSGLTLGPATGVLVKEWVLDGQPSEEWALKFAP